MPPKQQSKADFAKKQKIIEDKTGGLKNKSKNVRKYVHSLRQSVQPYAYPSKINAKKKEEEKELNDLLKIAVSQPKVPGCKHFLEAVEKKQYSWFWVCPNGGKDCHYRHALPPACISNCFNSYDSQTVHAIEEGKRSNREMQVWLLREARFMRMFVL
ncbi:hypothetical protein Ccrd_021768 [Cynara cardunculus var. scolymus]|uniref:C3H1-type domain-containing protein n=1 Tax=Cynara cardunculus var. scolymus TaxID=59895 RepID=A0A103XZZ8_CYNCS|nr:hypothetical protein Ccrd_021768 [Cynara cardunculus var. scolymus]